MAKKDKERIVLEDIELKPQVIGYTYQKKSNIGRVIIIFIAFLLAVFYINDISVFINNLLGKTTASTIGGNTTENNKKPSNVDATENEVIYNVYSNMLSITEGNVVLNNFNLTNNILTFDISNNSGEVVDLSNKKYFLETYTEDKTLLERHKVDINTINNSAKVSYELEMNSNFYYLVLEEKSIEDYPIVHLEYDESGYASISCMKGNENIIYNFSNDELLDIKQTISESDTTVEDYYLRYSAYQSKALSYNNIAGITATFNGSLNGYTAVFALDLQKVNLENIEEKYYYGYKEIPKVVKFEMETYGFTCN